MNRVWIDGEEIPPYPPRHGMTEAARYFSVEDGFLRVRNAAGEILTLAKGVIVRAELAGLDVAAAKQREANRFAGRSRRDPAGDAARLERRRKAAKAAKQARKQARRRV